LNVVIISLIKDWFWCNRIRRHNKRQKGCCSNTGKHGKRPKTLTTRGVANYTQADPYLIGFLGWNKYIDIIKKALIGWVEKYVSISPLCFLYEMLLAQDYGLEFLFFLFSLITNM
jgi:hypothetical protein